MSQIYKLDIVIKEIYLDTFGHVNNAHYLTLFEDARWDLLNANGYGLDKIKSSGLGPVILEINIKYLRELKARQKLIIETSCVEYPDKIGKMMQRMVKDDELYAQADIVFGLFSLKERKIVPPTKAWLEAIGV